jgi:hypothetical protein
MTSCWPFRPTIMWSTPSSRSPFVGVVRAGLLWLLVSIPSSTNAMVSGNGRPSPLTVEADVASCINQVAARQPWLGKTLWGLRDQEAGWIGAEIPNRNGTHDLGPFQINSSWLPRIAADVHRPIGDIRRWLRDDPCFSTATAAWIFLRTYRSTRDYWQAVGLYHSSTTWRQRRYTMSVVDHLTARFGAKVFDEEAGRRTVAKSNGQSITGGLSRRIVSYGFGAVQGDP